MKFKILAMMLAFLMGTSLCLISCGNNSPTSSSSPAATATPATVVPKSLSASTTIGSNTYFQWPVGIAYASGHLWIADQDNLNLQEWVTNGASPTRTINSYGSSPTFGGLNQDGIDPKTGNVYITDEQHKEVGVFSSTGTYLTVFGSSTFTTPYGVAVNAAGTTVYVSDSSTNGLYAFAIGGTASSPTYGTPTSFSTSGSGALSSPQGVAVDGNGNVWVADSSHGLLKEFSASGSYNRSVTSSLATSAFDPTGLVFDSSNCIYVTDQNNHNLVEFTSSGAATLVSGATALSSPQGITTDDAGNFYVVDPARPGFVWFH